uniref:Putative structural protein n=1 Tax=viral metagenome TaxID=1070528 RepID=A0A6M3KUT8_9ZZZZ
MSLSLHIKEHSILGIKSNDGELTTVTAPLVLTGYDVSIPVATSSANGYLSSTDWTTFNSKQSVLWTRAGTTLSPNTANDNIDIGSGNIDTTGAISDGVATLSDGALSGITTLGLSHTAPYITTINTTAEDTDYGRENRWIAKGTQSGSELTTLGYAEFAHDGTSDDQKGIFTLATNDGTDGDTPTPRVTVDSAGNVGIGTASPGSLLHLYKSGGNIDLNVQTTGAGDYASTLRASSDDNVIALGAYDDNYSTVATYAGKGVIQTTGGSLSLSAFQAGYNIEFYAGQRTTPNVIIKDGGNVGIRTTAPDRNLEINTGAATGGIRLTYNDADGSATTYGEMLVDSSGDLAITATGGDISFGNENLSTTGSITGNSYVVADGGTIGSASDPDVITIDASGNATFSVFPITPSAAPDADYEVANKKYVDDNVGGATTALNNLASVAINTSLISDTDSTDSLGSTDKYWANTYTDAVHMDKIGSNTLLVGAGKDYTTITLAMAAASANDTILVAEGTYAEKVTFTQDNLTLRALGSAENTIINAPANGMGVEFSTMSGCTLDGFTINQTSINSSTDYCINSSNDSASDATTIKNCIINVSIDNGTNDTTAIRITDGDAIIENCRIASANASTSAKAITGVQLVPADHTYHVRDNVATITNSGTSADATTIGLQNTGGSTAYFHNNTVILSSDATGVGGSYTLYVKNGFCVGNTIRVTSTSTGLSKAILVSAAGTVHITANNIYSVTGDADGEWLSNGGTVYACGNIITGDAGITAGTLYPAGNYINDALQAPDGSAASTGVGSIKMANASAADSAGFLKMAKEDGTVVYVPYFSDETP